MPSQLALSYVSAITWLSFFSLSHHIKIHHLSYPITFRESFPVTRYPTNHHKWMPCQPKKKSLHRSHPMIPLCELQWELQKLVKLNPSELLLEICEFSPKNPRGKCGMRSVFFPFQKHGSHVSMTFEDQKTERRPSIITSTSWYDKCTISHSLRLVIDLNWFFADFYTPLTEAGMQKEHLGSWQDPFNGPS